MREIRTKISLQPKQKIFFHSKADIAFFGGAAGGGKTYTAATIPLKYLGVPGFNTVIFRRTSGELTQPGAIWDEAANLYTQLGGKPHQTDLTYKFGKMQIKFDHMQHAKDRFKKHGAQYSLVIFEEVTTFEASQFWYMFSRMRSMTGLGTKMRATCNPDCDSWVAPLIAWWIDQNTGYPIPERGGVLRWFVRRGDDLKWFDSKEDALIEYPTARPKSFTFIPSSIEDNRALLNKDPDYLANLESLCLVERERLLHGNWKIRPAAGLYFKRSYFSTITQEEFNKTVPTNAVYIRYWDLASSKEKQKTSEAGQPCRTAGVKMTIHNNKIYIVHIEKFRQSPLIVEQQIKNMAQQDGFNCYVAIEEDPGQAGVALSAHYQTLLTGYATLFPRPAENKVVRASPLSAKAEDLDVILVHGQWNEDFISEAESFPESKFKDQIDAASGAYNTLMNMPHIWVA